METGGSPSDDILHLCSGGFPNTIPPLQTLATPTSSSCGSGSEGGSCVGDRGRPYSAEQRESPVKPDELAGVTSSIPGRGGGAIARSSNLSNSSRPRSSLPQQLACSGDASSEEEGDEDNAVLRWAHRHQHGVDKERDDAAAQGGVVSNGHGMLELSEDEDEDIPLITRRKVVMIRPEHTKA